MDEKRYELVEIQVDAELLEQLEAVIAPMGLTPEMLAVKFFEFCVDPATQELAISLLLKWKAEQEAEGGESGRGTLMLSKETFCEALRKIQAQKDRDEQFSKALTLMGDGHFVFEGGAPLLAALLDVLTSGITEQDIPNAIYPRLRVAIYCSVLVRAGYSIEEIVRIIEAYFNGRIT